MGRFRYISRDDRWEWSDELARIYGYQPGRVRPTADLLIAHKHPDDKAVVAEMVERVCRYGMACSNQLRIIDTHGDTHVVVVVANPLYDGKGALAGTAGFYVDITEQFESDVQKRLTESVAAVNSRRALINQAIGVLMHEYRLDADSAFQLLAKWSQESNTKLRLLAERVTGDPGARDALLNDAADTVAKLLRTAREGSK
ncbi:ANTAR domain protein [Mycobacterium basiliense]|uniref:ANTAR domain protein n=1 Tax=Mycobacterium basiliense TaxID=2094119 RepID=A0A447GKF4_9MYCO|nr:PAS and ANTAR domain-containing protein [Mycobacterium basiliense]VDM90982.1 ANTAR domain protein [Mycobacterium basiliense]